MHFVALKHKPDISRRKPVFEYIMGFHDVTTRKCILFTFHMHSVASFIPRRFKCHAVVYVHCIVREHSSLHFKFISSSREVHFCVLLPCLLCLLHNVSECLPRLPPLGDCSLVYSLGARICPEKRSFPGRVFGQARPGGPLPVRQDQRRPPGNGAVPGMRAITVPG